jgi:hypothetical protein
MLIVAHINQRVFIFLQNWNLYEVLNNYLARNLSVAQKNLRFLTQGAALG